MQLQNEQKGRGIAADSSGTFGVYVTTTNGSTYSEGGREATILLLSRDEALALMAELATAIATTDLNREAEEGAA